MYFDLAFNIVFCDVKTMECIWICFVFYLWNRDTVLVLPSVRQCRVVNFILNFKVFSTVHHWQKIDNMRLEHSSTICNCLYSIKQYIAADIISQKAVSMDVND